MTKQETEAIIKEVDKLLAALPADYQVAFGIQSECGENRETKAVEIQIRHGANIIKFSHAWQTGDTFDSYRQSLITRLLHTEFWKYVTLEE